MSFLIYFHFTNESGYLPFPLALLSRRNKVPFLLFIQDPALCEARQTQLHKPVSSLPGTTASSVSLTLSVQLRKPCLLPDQCLLLHQPLFSTASFHSGHRHVQVSPSFEKKKKCVSSQPTPGCPWATKALKGRICITDSRACSFPFPTAHPHLAMDLAEDFSRPGGCYALFPASALPPWPLSLLLAPN